MTGYRRLLEACGWLLIATPIFISQAASVTSSSGRFWVSGKNASQNFEYARWAELTAEKLEASLGRPLPLSRAEPVEIILDPDPTLTPDVTARLLRSPGTLRRLLIISTIQTVDPLRLQERLVYLLLAGLIDQHRRDGNWPQALPVIPAWFTAGLAGSLDRLQLARSRAIVMDPRFGVTSIPLQEVFTWTNLPEGWHSRQALCAWVVDWLMSNPGGKSNLLNHLIRQREITPEGMAAIWGAPSLEVMEMKWRMWLRQQAQSVQEFGAITPEMIEQLRRVLWLQVPTVVQGEMVLHALSPSEVISERRNVQAITKLAAVKMASIQRVTLGTAPEFVEVGQKYVTFYEGVARGAWGVVLRWRLQQADEALQYLAEQTKLRRAYVDAFEGNGNGAWQGREGTAAESGIPGLEKSRMESYLDEAEKRFDKPR